MWIKTKSEHCTEIHGRFRLFGRVRQLKRNCVFFYANSNSLGKFIIATFYWNSTSNSAKIKFLSLTSSERTATLNFKNSSRWYIERACLQNVAQEITRFWLETTWEITRLLDEYWGFLDFNGLVLLTSNLTFMYLSLSVTKSSLLVILSE